MVTFAKGVNENTVRTKKNIAPNEAMAGYYPKNQSLSFRLKIKHSTQKHSSRTRDIEWVAHT
jgi:hypothetical protein